MYEQINMTRPEPDLSAMQKLATDYATLANALTTAEAEVETQIGYILSNNSGDAVDAFSASERGSSSIADHLQELVSAASRTSSAYSEATKVATSAMVVLDTLDQRFDSAFWEALFVTGNLAVANQVVQQASSQMRAVEGKAADDVISPFSSLLLPPPFTPSVQDELGHLDSGIDDEFNKIAREDPERAKQILQKMADDYADANGIPRVVLKFDKLSGAYGERSGDGSITLDTDTLNGDEPSILLNTVIHEMEHSRQYEGMKFHWPWIMDRGNMSPEEGERWKRLNQDYVRNKGYWPRPVEVGARNAGRDYINQMTYQEFKDKYLK